MVVASLSPIGPAVVFTLSAVATYAAIRNIINYLANDYGLDPGNPLLAVVKSIDDSLNAFEKKIGTYLEWAKKELGGLAESSLESVTGRAIEWSGGESAAIPGSDNDILIGDDVSALYGDEKNNWLIHRSAGEVFGDKGDDVLIGWTPEVIKPGEALERSVRDKERAAARQKEEWQKSGDPRGDLPLPKGDADAKRAEKEYTLTLDGGEGNDWVIVIGGEKATTAGGLGRDWIYNTSKGGIIYGDLRASNGEVVADAPENADCFWFAPDTVIKDAQHYDVLKFYGLTLTGGDATASALGLTVGMSTGSLTVANGMLAAGNMAAAATGNKIYFDHLLPFITYKRDGKDLLVANVFTDLYRMITGLGSLLMPGPKDDGYTGVMRIENFDFVSSMWGYEQVELSSVGDKKPPGTMNMVFKDGNPMMGLLNLIAALPSVAGSGLYGQMLQTFMTLDSVIVLMAAQLRAAKSAMWALGADPLIIDLDGDGIETTNIGDGKVYFDLDGDRFAERTGWLSGDDGFLVVDANRNGRIDDISEMFGNRFEGGYAELSQYDSNGDGKITAADLKWGDLKVWRDKNQNGVTDAGELSSLDELGIVELNLTTTAVDVTTPQQTRLQSWGEVFFDGGRVSRMFEAIFDSSA